MTMQKKLAALRVKYAAILSDAFFESVSNITDNVALGQLISAIERGDFESAVQILGVDRTAFRPLERASAELFEETGNITATAINATAVRRGVRGASAQFRFDVRATRAENWLNLHSSTLITRIADDTRAAVRMRLEEGMVTGRNPRNVALDIIGRIDPGTGRRVGGIVGLTGPQERYLRNARDELAGGDLANYLTRKARDKRFDKYALRALQDGTPIPADIQAKMAARYSDNLLKVRGEAIARTEMIESLNHAQFEAFEQARDQGKIQDARKVWDSAGNDGRTRDSHLKLDGTAVGLNEPFVSPATGRSMMFPGDSSMGADGEDIINCRCRVRYDVDF